MTPTTPSTGTDRPRETVDHRVHATATRPTVGALRGHGETVLVIDDDLAVREVLGAVLKMNGYRTLLAADGAAGLALYREHSVEIKVVLTDILMPGMSGSEVIAALRELNPAVRILAVSGLVDAEEMGVPTESGRLELLFKPLTSGPLLEAVARLLAGRG